MPDTSSSMATESSTGWADIVKLGRQITEQLGQGDDDIALSWMAHHVARLMVEAEAAEGDLAAAAQERCRRAILDMWKARRAIFDRVPLSNMEEVGEAVRALKSGEDWFFRRMDSDGDDETPKAVHLAHAVDHSARAIIRVLISDAVRQGLFEERDWIWLVRSGLPDIDPIILLMEDAVVTSPDAPEEGGADRAIREAEAADQVSRAERASLVERLRGLVSVADAIAASLETPTRV